MYKRQGIFYVTWGAIIYGCFLLSRGLFNKYLVKRATSKEPKEDINFMKIIGIILLVICLSLIHIYARATIQDVENTPALQY